MFPPRAGPQLLSDDAQAPQRLSRDGCSVSVEAHPYYAEAVYRRNVYSLGITTTAMGAGQIIGAAGGAATNLALFNPVKSGVLLALLVLRFGWISGSGPSGTLFNGLIANVPTAAAVGTIASNFLGCGIASAAIPYASAAGVALTGGVAPAVVMASTLNTVHSGVSAPYTVPTACPIDGILIVQPGSGWLPLWGASAPLEVAAYSITWEEIPL